MSAFPSGAEALCFIGHVAARDPPTGWVPRSCPDTKQDLKFFHCGLKAEEDYGGEGQGDAGELAAGGALAQDEGG